LWDYAVRVLEGTQDDDRLFALIPTIDPEDDPWEEASWVKANPSGAKPFSLRLSAHHAPDTQQSGAGDGRADPIPEHLGRC
jgi:phage terminase large subunit-like protein